MKIIKCNQFSNHYLLSKYVPKSIEPARLRYRVVKSAQGSNPKVTVEYSIKLLLDLKKQKAERKLWICKCSLLPFLKHLQIQSEALRTKAFV